MDRAWAADLVQRVEAAALAATAQIVVQHHRRLPELRGTEVVDRAAEIRVIENVEEIASRLKRNPFCEVELAAQRDIPLRGAESAQGIASKIALSRGWHRHGERSRIDDLASGCVWLVEIERHAGHEVWPLHAVRAGQHAARKRILARDHIHWRSTARIND